MFYVLSLSFFFPGSSFCNIRKQLKNETKIKSKSIRYNVSGKNVSRACVHVFTIAGGGTGQMITVTAPGTLPSGASQIVDQSFLGLAMEVASL